MSIDLERAVQWYPGHMVKAMRKIGEYMSLIDIVIEVIDARVPESGANPMLDTIVGDRPRIVILNRDDLADRAITKAWLADFAKNGRNAIATTGRDQSSVTRLVESVTAMAKKRSGMNRALIVGVPNSGKSSIINGLLRRGAAKTEDRAGVTRQLQWFRLAPNVEVMDTPGILVPKIATKDAMWKLAICGAVPRERYDPEEIVINFHRWLMRGHPRSKVPDLEAFAKARGFVRKGAEIDFHNAAQSYIRTFNEGGFGRLTLEKPDDDRSDQSA